MQSKNKKAKKGFTCWNCGKYHKFGTTWCDKCSSDIDESATRDQRAAMRQNESY